MRRAAALMLVCCLSQTAHARALGVGVGPILGEPVGATAAARFYDRFAAQMHAGWRFSQRRMHLSLDGLVDLFDIPTDDAMGFSYPVYTGLGFRVLTGNSSGRSTSVGIRWPMGVAVIPDASPVEVFFEVTPVFALTPPGTVGLDAILGARVVF